VNVAPVVQPQPWTPAPPAAPIGADAPATEQGVPLSGALLVPRMGLVVGGKGTEVLECSGGSGTGGSAGTSNSCVPKEHSTSVDDKSSVAFGLDLLGHVSRHVRLGAGIRWVPSTNFGTSQGSQSMGHDLTATGVLEGIVPASPSLRIALRAEAGIIKLFPGGSYQDSLDQAKRNCSSGNCTIDEPSHAGFTCGFGPGLIFPMRKFNLRTDLLYQAWWMDLYSHSYPTATYKDSWQAERVMLMVGMELGL
jgi:hypothetical protein